MTGATEWSGAVGSVWAQEHARTEQALAGVAAVLDAAIVAVAPARGRAVDLGCGGGSTALTLAAARPGLTITGVDLSAELVAVARARPARAGVSFMAGDIAEVLPGLTPVDLLVSRHGVMFFDDPVAGFASLRHGAVAGAPLVFSCFRARAENDWAVSLDNALDLVRPVAPGYAPGPFALSERATVQEVLTDAGWRDVRLHAHDVDYVVGTGDDPVADALAFYRRIGPAASVLAAAEPDQRVELERRLGDMLSRRIRDGAVTFSAAIWVVSARAPKELS